MSEATRVDGSLRELSGYNALPRVGRLVLIAVVLLGVTAEAVVGRFAEVDGVPMTLDVASMLLLILFAWRPPIATAALIVISPLALAIDDAGFFGITLAASAGLVLYCCSPWLVLAYCALGTAWITASEFVANDLEHGGSIAMLAIGIVSGVIGHSMRVGRRRARSFAAENERLSIAARNAITLERERISDELHNIIAHELTVITLQTRALPLTQNEMERDAMIGAIGRSSEQALTDVRRMMKIVQDGDPSQSNEGVVASFPEALESSVRHLQDLGIEVELNGTVHVSVSQSIETTLVHLVSECTTNVLKHARSSKTVVIDVSEDAGRLNLAFRSELVESVPNAARGPHEGYGLRRMADRIGLLGGVLDISKQDGWWTIVVSMPRA
ncbi:MAG TPA: histidine kinase [Plantibacter sp.]|uniref:sensor histidine kinase n=1 Tax=unclassified Plantibacter TaxID=2624265 RepID=UPI002C297687|nr:histidine kinase [Plantibacter sp.]